MSRIKDYSKEIIKKMRQVYALHKAIYDESGEVVDLEFIEVNAAFAQAVEVTQESLVGNRMRGVSSFKTDEVTQWIKFITDYKKDESNTISSRRRFRNRFYDVERFSPEDDYYVLVGHDVTELKKSQEQLKYRAYYDSMTDLPNRLKFRDIVAKTLASNKGTYVVAYLDIDNFKEINDQYGHDVGDKLLYEVAGRLAFFAGDHVVVARTSGDEFGVMVNNVENIEDIWHLCGEMRQAVSRPIHFEDYEFTVTICIGFAKGYGQITSDKQLMRWADIAVHRAKRSGANKVLAYDDTMLKQINNKFEVKERLKTAIRNQSFTLLYQPQIKRDNEEVSGFEALVRLKDYDGSLISPMVFIPVAEESNLIHQLGEWVLREACLQLSRWHQLADNHLTMSVNVSAVQLRRDDFSDRVKSIIKETGIQPGYLELEITETAILNKEATVMAQIRALKAYGVMIALDDFGTGYSSLSHILELPIDIVKVDRSFVQEIEESCEKAKIVCALIDMVSSIGKKVVAEGVETEGQLDFLRRCRCDLIQGYYYARPLAADAAVKMVIQKNGRKKYQ